MDAAPASPAAPAAAPAPPTRDPVCGMEVDPAGPPGGTVERGRYRYHFCSEGCRGRFEAEPERFFAYDPVCHMEVNPKAPKGGQWEHQGTTYFFCNPKCLAKFSADPATYLARKPGEPAPPPPAPAAPPGAEVVWVCPMCPEVRERTPVPCPTCGMGLEPLVVGGMPSAEEPPNPEYVSMSRRFWWGLAPTLALLAVAMGDMAAGMALSHRLGPRAFGLLQAALAAPVVLVGGWPFFERAWVSLRTWKRARGSNWPAFSTNISRARWLSGATRARSRTWLDSAPAAIGTTKARVSKTGINAFVILISVIVFIVSALSKQYTRGGSTTPAPMTAQPEPADEQDPLYGHQPQDDPAPGLVTGRTAAETGQLD